MIRNILMTGMIVISLIFSQAALSQEPQFSQYQTPKNPKRPWHVSAKQFKAEPFATGDVSRFMFDNWDGPAIPVWAYVPTGVDLQDAPIMLMMHGAKRNPARYLLEWAPHAQQHGFVVVAPEFSRGDFRGSRRYNRGNVWRRDDDNYVMVDEKLWSFSAIEPLFDYVVTALDSQQRTYTLYGHSAGAQFVHRFMYYKPQARVSRYMAANSGWYTLPDLNVEYPYGLKDSAITQETLELSLSKRVIVLLGDQDVDANSKSLRKTKEAMQQGEHRYNRGANFLRTGKTQAERFGVKFSWRALRVEGVGHSNSGIAEAAAPYIR